MNRAAWKQVAWLGGAALAASALTFGAVRARAAGIPAVELLTYTGYLEDPDGAPVAGKVAVAVEVWTAVADGTKVCEAVVDELELVSGRFQVALPACEAVVKKTPELWVEVRVDGVTLGRTKLGAVPFAIEAGHATLADNASTADKATSATTADKAVAASGALDTRIKSVESLTSCPVADAPGKYGFCIWHEDKGTRYSQTYPQAAATCKSKGARLCTFAEVSAAYAAGAEWCAFSWVADVAPDASGYVSYPMQAGKPGCHGPGVSFDANPATTLADANCCKL
jgi:hypothetical protein